MRLWTVSVAFFNRERPPNRRQWEVFFEALYTVLSHKTSTIGAFKTLQKKPLSPMQKKLAATAVERLQHGCYVWSLFQPFAQTLGSCILTLLRLCETGGYFEEGIDRVRTLLALQSKISRKLRQVLLYPACLLGLAVMFMCVISGFLLPQLREFLSQQSVQADAFTRMLFQLNTHAPTVLGGLTFAGSIFVFLKLKKHTAFSNLIGRRWLTYGYFTGNLSALLQQRVPLVQALKLTFTDVPIRGITFETLRKRLEEGQSFARAVDGFPKALQEAIATAEARGDIPSALQEWSRYCYQRYEECWMRVLKWTEPLCIIVIVSLVLLTIALMAQPLSQVFRSMDLEIFR